MNKIGRHIEHKHHGKKIDQTAIPLFHTFPSHCFGILFMIADVCRSVNDAMQPSADEF